MPSNGLLMSAEAIPSTFRREPIWREPARKQFLAALRPEPYVLMNMLGYDFRLAADVLGAGGFVSTRSGLNVLAPAVDAADYFNCGVHAHTCMALEDC